jgi:hypothetical protein
MLPLGPKEPISNRRQPILPHGAGAHAIVPLSGFFNTEAKKPERKINMARMRSHCHQACFLVINANNA